MSWPTDRVFLKEPPAPLQRRCDFCLTTHGELKLCTGCRLVRYCGWEHQVQHRPQHKGPCKKTARLREKVLHEEHRVRHALPDFLTPANAFETHAGRFGDLLTTRDYMLARVAVGDNAVRCGTLDGAVEALGILRDLIRLDRRDNWCLRDLMPTLLLRLDLDQECYDFVKWWETCGADRRYDWSDMTRPFLNVKGADVLEEPVFLLNKWTSLNFQSAILLLKLKLLVDIRNVKVARKVVSNRLPVELCALVEKEVIRSPLSAKFLGHANLEDIKDTLMNQCYYLGVHMCQSNRHFIFCLVQPPPERPPFRPEFGCPKGSPEEAVMALQTGYRSWWETLGTLDLLKEAYSRAHYAWQVRYGQVPKQLPPRWPRQTTKDAFDLGQMWEHLDCAIKDSAYLGPARETREEEFMRMMEDEMQMVEDDIRALWVDNMGVD